MSDDAKPTAAGAGPGNAGAASALGHACPAAARRPCHALARFARSCYCCRAGVEASGNALG